jgi:hypothetical protein
MLALLSLSSYEVESFGDLLWGDIRRKLHEDQSCDLYMTMGENIEALGHGGARDLYLLLR